MKTNELMTGDYVRVGKDGLCIPKNTIVKIRAIDELDSLVLKNGKKLIGSARCQPINPSSPGIWSYSLGGIWVDYLEPIQLTNEILEKNGFKKCEDGAWSLFQYKENGENALYQIYWSEDPLYLEISSYTSQTGEFNRMGIRFVHELQHALRLCEIEKEIEL